MRPNLLWGLLHRGLLWSSLAGLLWAELILMQGALGPSSLAYTSVLIGLLLLVATAPDDHAARLAQLLTLLPALRIMTLTLPLQLLPAYAAYIVTGLPVGLAAILLSLQLGLRPRQLGLTLPHVMMQLGLIGVGVSVGVVLYALLQPPALLAAPTFAQGFIVGMSLFLFNAAVEELFFRSLLRAVASPALGVGAPLFGAVLYTILSVSYRVATYLLIVFGLSLILWYVVGRMQSLFGATLLHGSLSVVLLLVMPILSEPRYTAYQPYVVAGTLVAAVIGVGSLLGLVWQQATQLFPAAYR